MFHASAAREQRFLRIRLRPASGALDLRARAARSALWSAGGRGGRPRPRPQRLQPFTAPRGPRRLTARGSALCPASSTPSGSPPATGRRRPPPARARRRTAALLRLQAPRAAHGDRPTSARAAAPRRATSARRRRPGSLAETSRASRRSSASPSASSSWARSPTTRAWRTGIAPPTSSSCRPRLTRASAWRPSRRSPRHAGGRHGDRRDSRASRAARPTSPRADGGPGGSGRRIADALDLATHGGLRRALPRARPRSASASPTPSQPGRQRSKRPAGDRSPRRRRRPPQLHEDRAHARGRRRAPGFRPCSCTPASTTTPRCRTSSSPSSACPSPMRPRRRLRHPRRADGARS